MEQFFGIIIHYVIPATILLGVLIFVHEFGHCLVAKLVGVRVLKFSLGFGPKLFGCKIGETEYLISLIPLGGYVKPLGEAPDEPVAEQDKPYSLNEQSVAKRFAVLVAGSLFNILFAILVFACVYMVGTPMLTTRVGQVMPDAPAYHAGLQAGDVIEAIDGRRIELWDELFEIVGASRGKELTLHVRRGDQLLVTALRPELAESLDVFGEKAQRYRIGIAASSAKEALIHKRYNPAVSLWKGIADTAKWSQLTLVGLGRIISSPSARGKEIGGPILIGKLAGDFAQASILSFIMLMAMISVNLGVLNLLPIPILDGGHIFFLCLEALKGRPVSMKKLEIAQQIGLALLLMLMVFVFYNDITRLISK
ncbi:MAG: RIP metalloprotease RseP [Deltaproteobacteria bacterium]|nr:RIP metalloprotease RseP [Deltaproteobacteria bacterium]